MSAGETLNAALLQLLEHEQRPPCSHDPEAWTSEDRDERAEAARRCNGCPLLDPCAAVAAELRVRWGVWAGVDRSPRPSRARAP